jgi:hypothetical protein
LVDCSAAGANEDDSYGLVAHSQRPGAISIISLQGLHQ